MKKLTVLLALGVLAVAVRVVLAQPPEPIEKTGGVLWDGHSSADPYAQVENITCDDFKIYAYDLGGQQAVAYALLGVAATQAFTQSVTIEISAGYQTYFDTFQWERPITETVTVFWGACIGAVCRQGIETLSCGEEPTPTATATATPTSTPVPEVGTVLEISYSRSGRKISLAGVEVTAAVTVSWGLPHGTVVDHVGAGETKEANWPEDPGTQLGVTINGSWGLFLQGTVWPGERIYRIFLPVIAKALLSTPTPTATPTVTPTPMATPTLTPTPTVVPTPPPSSLLTGASCEASNTYMGYVCSKANDGNTDQESRWVGTSNHESITFRLDQSGQANVGVLLRPFMFPDVPGDFTVVVDGEEIGVGHSGGSKKDTFVPYQGPLTEVQVVGSTGKSWTSLIEVWVW